MKSLLLVAHGSRREASNREVAELTRKLAGESPEFERVACAFLEIAEPSIRSGLEELIRAGATEIVVLPYFLSKGRHVAEDVPEEIAAVAREFPDVSIRQAPYLGLAESLPEILAGLARQART